MIKNNQDKALSIPTAALPKERIAILDGFRCLCILFVMLCHYLSAYTPEVTGTDYYPYHTTYSHYYIFRYGYLGVQCFFIISGFAIFMTLEKSRNIKEFAIKRFIRLWPTLLICSLVTFATLSIWPYKELQPNAADFLPSLTITQPYIWGRLFNINGYFIDSVEWTLVVEIGFYITSSLLYFINKKSFFRNWLILVTILISCHFVVELLGLTKIGRWLDLFLFPIRMAYFTAGIYFYFLFNKRKLTPGYHLITILLITIQLVFLQEVKEAVFIGGFLILFLLFIYKPTLIPFFSNKVVAKIGVMSYTIYLLHNWIGIILINKFATLFNSKSPIVILPTIVIVALAVIAVERIVKYIKDIFFNFLPVRN